jgi:hypothetical protein
MKKFALFLVWILSIVSCEKPNEKESKGFGKLNGYSYIVDKTHPASGYGVNLPGYGVQTINSEGHFEYSQVFEGKYTLSVTDNAGHFYKKDVEIQKDKTTFVEVILPDTRKDLPDFSVVDISKESTWDYEVVGKEECFYIDAENSLPKFVQYHSFKTGKDYGITFNEKGLPKRVITDNFIFFFDHFNGNKVDLGILSPSGESQIFREIKTDFTWPTASKSLQSKSDMIRWTGRIIGAIPCVTSGVTAVFTGGFAVPVALWTCGNYFIKLLDNFYDDADIENGFTQFVDDYKLNSTVYTCTTSGDPSSCLIALANQGLINYADYVEEMEKREAEIAKIEALIANNVPLKTIVIQPGPEGKDSHIILRSFDDCIELYEHSGNDSLIMVVYDHWGTCQKEFHRMLLQFPISGQVPSNATIFSARLAVYGVASRNDTITPVLSLMEVKSFWDENTTEWIKDSDLDLIGEIGFEGVQGMYSWRTWDVTYIIRDWVSGYKINFGFEISSYENSVYATIRSGDHPNAKTRPKLIISYY